MSSAICVGFSFLTFLLGFYTAVRVISKRDFFAVVFLQNIPYPASTRSCLLPSLIFWSLDVSANQWHAQCNFSLSALCPYVYSVLWSFRDPSGHLSFLTVYLFMLSLLSKFHTLQWAAYSPTNHLNRHFILPFHSNLTSLFAIGIIQTALKTYIFSLLEPMSMSPFLKGTKGTDTVKIIILRKGSYSGFSELDNHNVQ